MKNKAILRAGVIDDLLEKHDMPRKEFVGMWRGRPSMLSLWMTGRRNPSPANQSNLLNAVNAVLRKHNEPPLVWSDLFNHERRRHKVTVPRWIRKAKWYAQIRQQKVNSSPEEGNSYEPDGIVRN